MGDSSKSPRMASSSIESPPLLGRVQRCYVEKLSRVIVSPRYIQHHSSWPADVPASFNRSWPRRQDGWLIRSVGLIGPVVITVVASLLVATFGGHNRIACQYTCIGFFPLTEIRGTSSPVVMAAPCAAT